MRSDIFDDYCKIMEEKGFIKQADKTDPESLTEEAKFKRKDYAETIQALYGLDIELNDSKDPITEQAHPGMVFISPSYDKVNGLVENNQERQNIMVGLINEPTNGLLTGRKIAEVELFNELIRLGFTLDNYGKEKLSKQADFAAILLNNRIEKTAQKASLLRNVGKGFKGLKGLVSKKPQKNTLMGGPTLRNKPRRPGMNSNPWHNIPSWSLGDKVDTATDVAATASAFIPGFGWAISLGILAAGMAVKTNLIGNITEGLSKDIENALNEIEDIENKGSPKAQQIVSTVKNQLNSLLASFQEYSNLTVKISNIEDEIENAVKAKDSQKIIPLSENLEKLVYEQIQWGEDFKQISSVIQNLMKELNRIKPELDTFMFSNEAWKAVTKSVQFFTGNDFTEAMSSIKLISDDLNELIKTNSEQLVSLKQISNKVKDVAEGGDISQLKIKEYLSKQYEQDEKESDDLEKKIKEQIGKDSPEDEDEDDTPEYFKEALNRFRATDISLG